MKKKNSKKKFQKKSKNFFSKKKKKLDSLLTAREEGENFKPYYSFVALSSKKLSANKRTDRQTDGNSKICISMMYAAYSN
jgi:hypothetical protein